MNMQSIMFMQTSIKQVAIQRSGCAKTDGEIRVLKAEIKQDGGATEAKAKRLEELESKSEKQAATQMGMLSDLNKKINEAAKEEQKDQKDKEKTEPSDSKKEIRDEKTKPEGDVKMYNKVPLESVMGTYNAQGVLQVFTDYEGITQREYSDVVLDIHV